MKRLLVGMLMVASICEARVAPLFQGDTLDGHRVQLSTYLKPKKILLLSFWASWCVPCVQELKLISEFSKTAEASAVDVLTVNVDRSDTKSDIKPTLKLNHFEFPVVVDPKHEIFSVYQAEKSLPYSVVINERGEIIETFNGYTESMVSRLKELSAAGVKPNAG